MIFLCFIFWILLEVYYESIAGWFADLGFLTGMDFFIHIANFIGRDDFLSKFVILLPFILLMSFSQSIKRQGCEQ